MKIKKLLSLSIAATLAISNLALPVKASSSVNVNETENQIEFSNDYLSRTFLIDNGTLQTKEIKNKQTNRSLIPGVGSQDFIINTLPLDEKQSSKLDPTNWTYSLTGETGEFSEAQLKNLFDDDLNSIVDNPNEAQGNPFTLTIDFGEIQKVKSMSVDKRPGVTKDYAVQYPHGGKRGVMGEYSINISKDGNNWKSLLEGEFTAEDWNLHDVGNYTNVGDTVHVNFSEEISTRYIQVIQKSNAFEKDYQEFTSAELDFYSVDYEDYLDEENSTNTILSSELTYKDYIIKDIENGKQLEINFDPYLYNGIKYSISEIYTLGNDDHYLRSQLAIHVDDKEKAKIDYIEMDHFMLDSSLEGVWSKPDDSNISSMYLDAHELMLGQPIYANSFFLGSEFPAAETDIVDNVTQIRYYSGKNFATLEDEGELKNEKFVTWNNVVGVATDIDQAVVQTALFDYINDIATKTEFRKQYNSWYDNMLNITDESLENSFMKTEENLSDQGIEPLDSYVADDGWNAYPGSYENKTGFWEFNSKFKNELYPSSSLANKLNSSFGLWVGPQGGFSTPNEFGEYLESQGTGYAQNSRIWGKVICTGSNKYIENFTSRFLDYQRRFDIDYWKWDGFAMSPCNNANHDHITGGQDDMYFNTEKWERWINVFEIFRDARAQEGKGLWISATNHVNLSPWLLQWINSIWIQDSGDTGEAGSGGERHQQKIYYRDDVYNKLIYQNQVQFPLKNVYNHDPIYGVSDGSNASTDVFREFLFDNAMRGTAFWELYYSPDIMDEEKWMVTADALEFAERNHEVLQHAKLFVQEGKKPSNGVYGYSAWTENKGFVSFVNSTSTEQTYTLPLINVYGVPVGMNGLKKTQIYPYTTDKDDAVVNYGDELTVTLQPHSSLIYQFGVDDTQAPNVVSAKIIDNNILRVKFDERINGNDTSVLINGQKETGTLLADYRTIEFNLEGLGNNAKVETTAVDMFGNTSGKQLMNALNKTIAVVSSKEDLDKNLDEYEKEDKKFIKLDGNEFVITNQGIEGSSDFTISLAINTTDTDTILVNQEGTFSLSIDSEGYVVFDVFGTKVTSKEEVTTVIEKAHGIINTENYVPTTTNTTTIGKVNDGGTHTVNAIREANGMLKLYVDGKLSASAYDETKAKKSSTMKSITLGSANYNGLVSDVQVLNEALFNNEIKTYAESFKLNDDGQLDRTNWNAEGCSEASSSVGTGSDGAALDVLDGKNNTYWHTNYGGSDPCADGKHWLKIDFGKETTFDQLEYIARPETQKENGVWIKATVYGINVDGSEVEILKDQLITLNGRSYTFEFDSQQKYHGVKFVFEGIGGFGTAAEIYAKLTPPDYASTKDVFSLMDHASELLNSVDEKNCTIESYRPFKEMVDEISKLNPFSTLASDIETMTVKLEETYKGLVYKSADYTVVNNAIAKAKALDKNLYKDFTAVDNAVKAIVFDLDITHQKEVDAMAQAILDAINALEYKDADYSKVDEAIKQAEVLNPENYKDFSQVEKAIKDVVRGLDITHQEEVNAMAQAIMDAIASLEEKDETPVDPESPTDPNLPGNGDQGSSGGAETSDLSNVGGIIAVFIASILTFTLIIRKKISEQK